MMGDGAIGGYRLIESVAREGGMATVWKAAGPDGRPVAVKVAKEGRGKWLLRERDTYREILERVDGRADWVVRMIGDGIDPRGRPYVVLPWFDWSLEAWIERRSPPLPAVIDALFQAASALHRFHETGDHPGMPRLHRDVKPGNFLIEEGPAGPRVVLGDLGTARTEELTGAAGQSRVYSPGFAPGEQAMGLMRSWDPSIDVHAMGVTIYWCLTRAFPDRLTAEPPLLPPGRDLQRLRREVRTPEERAALQELERRPLHELIDVIEAAPPTDRDLNRLRDALETELRARTPEAPAIAVEIAQVLHEPLRKALHPDPRQRDRDLRLLVSAVKATAEVLVKRGLAPAEGIATGGERLPRPPPPREGPLPAGPTISLSPGPPPRHAAWAAAGFGAAVALVALLGVVGVGAWLVWTYLAPIEVRITVEAGDRKVTIDGVETRELVLREGGTHSIKAEDQPECGWDVVATRRGRSMEVRATGEDDTTMADGAFTTLTCPAVAAPEPVAVVTAPVEPVVATDPIPTTRPPKDPEKDPARVVIVQPPPPDPEPTPPPSLSWRLRCDGMTGSSVYLHGTRVGELGQPEAFRAEGAGDHTVIVKPDGGEPRTIQFLVQGDSDRLLVTQSGREVRPRPDGIYVFRCGV